MSAQQSEFVVWPLRSAHAGPVDFMTTWYVPCGVPAFTASVDLFVDVNRDVPIKSLTVYVPDPKTLASSLSLATPDAADPVIVHDTGSAPNSATNTYNKSQIALLGCFAICAVDVQAIASLSEERHHELLSAQDTLATDPEDVCSCCYGIGPVLQALPSRRLDECISNCKNNCTCISKTSVVNDVGVKVIVTSTCPLLGTIPAVGCITKALLGFSVVMVNSKSMGTLHVMVTVCVNISPIEAFPKSTRRGKCTVFMTG